MGLSGRGGEKIYNRNILLMNNKDVWDFFGLNSFVMKKKVKT